MFSLFNFSSIFFRGSADPICPYVRTPMNRPHLRVTQLALSLSYRSRAADTTHDGHLLMTSLCTFSQFSVSAAVPTLGAMSRRRVPATFTALHTATDTQPRTHAPLHSRLQRQHYQHLYNKKLCYRRRTPRCAMSVEILSTVAQL